LPQNLRRRSPDEATATPSALLRGAKSLRVNGTDVVGQQDLKDGDQIEVAGVKLTFDLLSGKK